MDSRKVTTPDLNYEDFDPYYDQIQEPEVDILLIHLPGFRKDQLRVRITRTGILKISGERQLKGDKWQRFLKEFQVPSNCETNRISAKFESGTLYITQPKFIITEEEESNWSMKGEESEDSKSDPMTEPENDSRIEPGEQTKLDDDASSYKNDKMAAAVAGKSEGEKSGGAGKAAKIMDGYSGNGEAAVQLKRSRKMMNVALVVLLVVGVGFYLNTKIRSSSSNVIVNIYNTKY